MLTQTCPNGADVFRNHPAGWLFFCPPDGLRIHPDNMRRFYPPEQVREMANSIKANGGVLQALLVIPDPDWAGGYLVVDGNMRLMGARELGADCPPLKCEVIEADRARQLLIMATTSAVHYPKDPISEALHYKRLIGEGFTRRDIARQMGVVESTIVSRLKLLELDEPIQRFVANGKLPKDQLLTDALLTIPDGKVRVTLAERLAADPKTTTKSARASALKVAEQMTGTTAAAKKPELKLDIPLFNRFVGNVIVEMERNAAVLEQCAVALAECGMYEQATAALGRANKNRRLKQIALQGKHPAQVAAGKRG